MKGILSNTQHREHINFHEIFHNSSFLNKNFSNQISENVDFNVNLSEQDFIETKNIIFKNLTYIHDHSIHKHHFENIDFNETIQLFLKEEGNSIKRITKFLTKNFNTFIPSEKDMHYFGQLKNQKCAKAILTKFFDSFLFEHILDFLNKIKDKHGETLKRFYDYLENKENEIYEKDKRSLKAYKSHEYLKLFIISDFIVSSYLSDLKLSEDEKKAYEDLKGYYNLVIRSINFSSDVVELFSSKIFEEIVKEIKSYIKLFKDKSNDLILYKKGLFKENKNSNDFYNNKEKIDKNIESIINEEISEINKKRKDQKININLIKNNKQEKESKDNLDMKKNHPKLENTKEVEINIKNLVKKLILISSHDTHISANMWFLGINANSHDYNYNDELTLILHFEDEEMYLEIKYNDKTVVPDFCERHPKKSNICVFDKYLDFIEKRIHRDELLNDFCNEVIDKFPAYLERKTNIKDDL